MKRLLTVVALVAMCTPALAQNNPGQPKPTTPPANAQPAAKKPEATKPATPATPATPADKAAKPAGEMDPKVMMEAMEAAGKPGVYHKWLENLEGNWNAVVKELNPVDGKWTEEKGEMTSKMVFGGRFLEMEFKGRSQGKPFSGFGTYGYNNTDKRFESTWYGSTCSGLCFMTGQTDAGQRVLTMKNAGEPMTCPVTGEKCQMRGVTTLTAKDTFTQEFYMTMGGTETKMMEIVYTRAKSSGDSKVNEKKTH